MTQEEGALAELAAIVSWIEGHCTCDDLHPCDQHKRLCPACKNADAIVALTAAPLESRSTFPKLTKAAIEAAADAHYGKRRSRMGGGADGISMTVDNKDYSFTDFMRRIWPALRSSLSTPPQPEGE